MKVTLYTLIAAAFAITPVLAGPTASETDKAQTLETASNSTRGSGANIQDVADAGGSQADTAGASQAPSGDAGGSQADTAGASQAPNADAGAGAKAGDEKKEGNGDHHKKHHHKK